MATKKKLTALPSQVIFPDGGSECLQSLSREEKQRVQEAILANIAQCLENICLSDVKKWELLEEFLTENLPD